MSDSFVRCQCAKIGDVIRGNCGDISVSGKTFAYLGCMRLSFHWTDSYPVAQFWFIWPDMLGLPEYSPVYITLRRMSVPLHPHQRSLMARGFYFVCGPLLGFPLLFFALFLGLTGPPSGLAPAFGATTGYVGLWLAFLNPPSGRSTQVWVTSTLLVLGLLAVGPYLLGFRLMFLNPPFSAGPLSVATFFLAPPAVAVHYLYSAALVLWLATPDMSSAEEDHVAP